MYNNKIQIFLGISGILYGTIRTILLYFGIFTSSNPGFDIVSSTIIIVTSTLLLGLVYLKKKGIEIIPKNENNDKTTENN